MQVELRGIVKVVFAEQKINDKLDKKEIVITVDEKTEYPQDIIVEAINKQIKLLSDINAGDVVVAKCNLRGKSSNGKNYFNKLNIWEINKL
jgi:hypothetical protein